MYYSLSHVLCRRYKREGFPALLSYLACSLFYKNNKQFICPITYLATTSTTMESNDSKPLTIVARAISESTPNDLCHHFSRQLWSFRYAVESTLFNQTKYPNEKDHQAKSANLDKLQEFANYQAKAICCTKMLQVLKKILRLAHIPYKELQLKKRLLPLLKKLAK